ncbi:MarR family winged helix-turn-helix transcriptional regulator [Streptomyces sp. AK02-01A]|uniref:MarR family winged helix-turn-helix transcriptional regulator n=1 Tax=Streptomyces sp. AK02-01A TaxID=3028648 RepID=UPI0029AFB0FC|nr:MarR family transcriptional regulator [Streptomyces sp. AK02-01A]MDX3850752.1 MarR family transcriptional regulator [Streptomyces sp. AK02-01A]
MTEPRWLDETEARVWRAHLRVQRELMGTLSRLLAHDSGLSGAEYEVLVPLSEAPDGLLRARDLSEEVDWERSRLSHQISRMEKRGLVAREECPDDARGAMVRLTEAGRAAVEGAAPGHVEAVRRYFFDALSRDDVDVLDALLGKLLAGLPNARSISGDELRP